MIGVKGIAYLQSQLLRGIAAQDGLLPRRVKETSVPLRLKTDTFAEFKLCEQRPCRADNPESVIVISKRVRNGELDTGGVVHRLIHRPWDISGRGFEMKDGVQHQL